MRDALGMDMKIMRCGLPCVPSRVVGVQFAGGKG